MSAQGQSISDIDTQAAAAAIDGAGGLQNVVEASYGRSSEATPPPGSEAQQTFEQARDPVTGRWVLPGQGVGDEQSITSSEAFTNVDPNTLPPELQSIYKSLQGDYTRKTQEIAQERKLFESLGGQEQVMQAAQLYQTLQNPAYWGQLHAELTENMQQLGIPIEQAEAQATAQVQQVQAQSGAESPIDWSDPDLAPLKVMYDDLQSVKSSITQREQSEQQERLQLALVGELQRQENLVRQTNPNYTDDDINSIYELSSFYQGNLLQAQQRYENIVQSRLERYMQGKQSDVGNAGVGPIPGGATFSSSGDKPQYTSLDDAHKAAMQRLAEWEAQDNV